MTLITNPSIKGIKLHVDCEFELFNLPFNLKFDRRKTSFTLKIGTELWNEIVEQNPTKSEQIEYFSIQVPLPTVLEKSLKEEDLSLQNLCDFARWFSCGYQVLDFQIEYVEGDFWNSN